MTDKTAPPPASAAATAPCLATITLDRHDSYLEEVRDRIGVHLADYQSRFEAKSVDPAVDQPLRAGVELAGGEPPFWFSPAAKAVVVDGRQFGALEVVDLPRLGAGDRRRVGRVVASSVVARSARQIVELLLRGGVLQTFWHIGAELCLRSESHDEGGYEARFDAVHTYFTNRGNRDAYRFIVRIGPDGEITVVGE